jgi:hypothetical protein
MEKKEPKPRPAPRIKRHLFLRQEMVEKIEAVAEAENRPFGRQIEIYLERGMRVDER